MMAVFLLQILVIASGIYFNYLSPNHDIMVDKKLIIHFYLILQIRSSVFVSNKKTINVKLFMITIACSNI